MQSMTYMHFLCRPELARVTNSAESVLSFDRRSCQYSIIMPPPVGKGTISVAFVRPSVAYTANNSRTQRPSVQKFGRKIPHLWCDSHTSFKVKRSKVKVTRLINIDTHRAYLPNGNAYELQTWYTDGGRRPASATCATTSKVKGQGQGYVISLSRHGLMAHKSKTNSRSITKIGKRVPYDTCYIAHQFQGQKVKGHGHRPTNADTRAISSER